MDFAHLVKLRIAASVLLMAIRFGIRALLAHATSSIRSLFQRPHSLLRALIAMNVAAPGRASPYTVTKRLSVRVAFMVSSFPDAC
jgi:hypothetical protein